MKPDKLQKSKQDHKVYVGTSTIVYIVQIGLCKDTVPVNELHHHRIVVFGLLLTQN